MAYRGTKGSHTRARCLFVCSISLVPSAVKQITQSNYHCLTSMILHFCSSFLSRSRQQEKKTYCHCRPASMNCRLCGVQTLRSMRWCYTGHMRHIGRVQHKEKMPIAVALTLLLLLLESRLCLLFESHSLTRFEPLYVVPSKKRYSCSSMRRRAGERVITQRPVWPHSDKSCTNAIAFTHVKRCTRTVETFWTSFSKGVSPRSWLSVKLCILVICFLLNWYFGTRKWKIWNS